MEKLDYILDQLKKLTAIPSPTGFTKNAANYVLEELTHLGYSPKLTVKGGVFCDLGGNDKEHALLLSAHIDTLGAMIAAIKPNGRLRVASVGGLQANNVETENCVIITRSGKTFDGTMQMNSPSAHVNKDYATQQRSFDIMEIVIDEKTNTKEDTEKLGIGVGDYVCFDPRTVITESGYLKSRFLDDKLSVAILLGLAKELKEQNKTPSRQLYLHITVFEEVGHGGRASVPQNVTEILAVDMGCVGEDLQCDEHKVSICAMDSAGPSNYEVTTKLIELAKANSLDYAVDVYPFYGSDADAALGAGYDIRHGLIGCGVYASHGYERSHIDGVKNTLGLLEAYVK